MQECIVKTCSAQTARRRRAVSGEISNMQRANGHKCIDALAHECPGGGAACAGRCGRSAPDLPPKISSKWRLLCQLPCRMNYLD